MPAAIPLLFEGIPNWPGTRTRIQVQGSTVSRTKVFFLVRLFLAVTTLAALEGCKGNSNQSQFVEKPISIATPQPWPGVSAIAKKLAAPTGTEVDAAFHRVFGDELTLSKANRPFFIQGDFNGDGSEDLALIACPAPGKLHDINSELANWIIQDADKALVPAPTKRAVVPPRAERPTIAAGEEVLAIIHGFGAMGWRNPDARQAYLVKHAAAPLLGTAPSFSQKAIREMHLPYETEIIRQVRNKRKGFLFWTGGVYAWHPTEG
jgi:hypothetical protein